MKQFGCLEGNHVLQEANQAADAFAKEGLKQPMQMHILINLPTFSYSTFVVVVDV